MIAPETGCRTSLRAGWFTRAIALLLVAAGLQAGSFRDLDSTQDRYFGSADYASAVLHEPRKALLAKAAPKSAHDEPPATGANDTVAIAPRAVGPVARRADAEQPAPFVAHVASFPHRLLPDPTGPPRA